MFKRIPAEHLKTRFQYALALSTGILGALVSVAAGAFCKPTATFDFVGSFTAPFDVLFEAWFIVIPIVLLIALVIFPFAPNRWRRRSVVTVLAVPVVLYVLLGGVFAIELYYYPYTGCL
jgi:hypothetical protein